MLFVNYLLFIYLLVLILFYGTSVPLAVTAIPLDTALAVLYGASPTKAPTAIPLDEMPAAQLRQS